MGFAGYDAWKTRLPDYCGDPAPEPGDEDFVCDWCGDDGGYDDQGDVVVLCPHCRGTHLTIDDLDEAFPPCPTT